MQLEVKLAISRQRGLVREVIWTFGVNERSGSDNQIKSLHLADNMSGPAIRG